ncbi:MAG TPA: aminomethyltransferase beta-barrel domain-containing protein [Nitrospiraceae bacterium]|nr:aminomethyltransferase beta-barrel domain-containing protein [Nitrospiraceae bacterium]
MHLAFHVPQRALSPGQSAVLYHGDRVLGGGMIQAI